jgi:chromosome segregation ATPase
MPDENTNGTGGARTNQGAGAGSETIQMTPKELQSKIDAAVTAALATREQNLAKEHQAKIDELTEQIETLKSAAEKGSKTQEELLRDAEQKIATLTAQVKALKQESKDLGSRFSEMLTAELGALGEDGKSKFEEVCPEGLGDADKLVFLAKVKPLLANRGEGQQNESGQEEAKGSEENPAQGKSPIPSHEASGEGQELGFGQRMAQQKRAEENAASAEGYDPWEQ